MPVVKFRPTILVTKRPKPQGPQTGYYIKFHYIKYLKYLFLSFCFHPLLLLLQQNNESNYEYRLWNVHNLITIIR
jgi:hypothetical protein